MGVIVWSGYGFAAAVVPVSCLFAGALIGFVSGCSVAPLLPVSFVVSGLILRPLGRRINRDGGHTMYLIPLQYWSFIWLMIFVYRNDAIWDMVARVFV